MKANVRSEPKACNLCGQIGSTRLLFRKGIFPVVQCRSCSLVYVDAELSQDDLDYIYSNYFFDVGSKYFRDLKNPSFINATQRIEKLLTLPGIQLDRWLDVGCATGDFPLAAERVVNQVYGVDISSHAVNQAISRGLSNISIGDFLELDLPNDQFDLVSMWDYIEHVQDPFGNLKKAAQMLKPGGYLALSTGDVDSLISHLSGRFWHLLTPPKHLYFFSRITFETLLRKAGFEQIKINYFGKHVPIDFMIWKATSLTIPSLSDPALRLVSRFKFTRAAPVVNLYDIMTVYARKPVTVARVRN